MRTKGSLTDVVERLGAIRICAKTFEVYIHKELPTERAYCDLKKGEIHLSDAHEDEVMDQMMHEILHAIFDAYGISWLLEKHNMEEDDLIYALAPALLATLQIDFPFDADPELDSEKTDDDELH